MTDKRINPIAAQSKRRWEQNRNRWAAHKAAPNPGLSELADAIRLEVRYAQHVLDCGEKYIPLTRPQYAFPLTRARLPLLRRLPSAGSR